MKILIAGGCDIPPPYGGLSARVLNNVIVWASEHEVHILLRWGKSTFDLLGATQVAPHFVYPPRPSHTLGKVGFLLKRRLMGAVAALIRDRDLAVRVLRESALLTTGQDGPHRLTTLLDALVYATAVDRLVAREAIDVIQAHYARSETLLCEIVAMRRNVPLVLMTYAEAVCWPTDDELATTGTADPSMSVWEPLFRRTFQSATHVCATSVHCAQGARRFVSDKKITVTYPCIDTATLRRHAENRESYKSELGLTGMRLVLFVGQLALRKGPQDLARAAPTILAAEPAAHIFFVGSDVNGHRVELAALVESLAGRVTFAGEVANELLWKYYAAADVLAFPSRTGRECLGMSMVEAMAAGVPVVAYDVGGTSEVVEDGVTGYLVEAGDVGKLAARLLAVLRGELGPDVASRCRDRAQQMFDVRTGARAELRILGEALASRKHAATE